MQYGILTEKIGTREFFYVTRDGEIALPSSPSLVAAMADREILIRVDAENLMRRTPSLGR